LKRPFQRIQATTRPTHCGVPPRSLRGKEPITRCRTNSSPRISSESTSSSQETRGIQELTGRFLCAGYAVDMWDFLAGKLARLMAVCLTLSILLPCVVYLFNHRLARNLAIFLAVWGFWISCSLLAVFTVWYVGACIVGLIRWRLDVRAEAR
jgi:hypothetical protein